MKMSTTTLRRSLEIAANLAIVVVAVIIVANFVRSRHKPREEPFAPFVGTKMSLSGVKWEENGSTLLMVLQKGCRYCEESAAFYRGLYEQRAQRSQPRILAVVPGEKAETVSYLSNHGVLVDDIINTSLSEIKVSATPTLLLIDQTGLVKAVWVGKLNESQEKEVTQRVLETH